MQLAYQREESRFLLSFKRVKVTLMTVMVHAIRLETSLFGPEIQQMLAGFLCNNYAIAAILMDINLLTAVGALGRKQNKYLLNLGADKINIRDQEDLKEISDISKLTMYQKLMALQNVVVRILLTAATVRNRVEV